MILTGLDEELGRYPVLGGIVIAVADGVGLQVAVRVVLERRRATNALPASD